jgi:hypothetical protein
VTGKPRGRGSCRLLLAVLACGGDVDDEAFLLQAFGQEPDRLIVVLDQSTRITASS